MLEAILLLVGFLHDSVFVSFLVDSPVSLSKLLGVVLETFFKQLHGLAELLQFEVEGTIVDIFVSHDCLAALLLTLRAGFRLVTALTDPVVAFTAVPYRFVAGVFLAHVASSAMSGVLF